MFVTTHMICTCIYIIVLQLKIQVQYVLDLDIFRFSRLGKHDSIDVVNCIKSIIKNENIVTSVVC